MEGVTPLTIYFDFKNIPLDTEYQMWKWLANIGIAKGTAQVIDLQRECPANGFRPLVILRFKQQAEYERFLDNNSSLFVVYNKDNIEYNVPITTSYKGQTLVRILNFPFDENENLLKEYLENYGKVGSLVREKPAKQLLEIMGDEVVYNRMRALMDIDKAIPQDAKVGNAQIRINYTGQPRVCAYCKKPGHFINVCPKKLEKNSNTNKRGWETISNKKGKKTNKIVNNDQQTPITSNNRFAILEHDFPPVYYQNTNTNAKNKTPEKEKTPKRVKTPKQLKTPEIKETPEKIETLGIASPDKMDLTPQENNTIPEIPIETIRSPVKSPEGTENVSANKTAHNNDSTNTVINGKIWSATGNNITPTHPLNRPRISLANHGNTSSYKRQLEPDTAKDNNGKFSKLPKTKT